MKRIQLKHGTARVDDNCSEDVIQALNELSVLAFHNQQTEMKESEKLYLQLDQVENEFEAMAIQRKIVGAERVEKFEFAYLPKIKAKFPVDNSIEYRWTIETDTHGIVDFYPKANNLLIRRTNKWKKPGLKWIINNLLKDR